ncbi:MAG TPA: fatty acid desaturase [Pirellulales bacterium]|jgi:fatty acid desaturase|nr:fatty acid desaturase [Pirellulales bacterium]
MTTPNAAGARPASGQIPFSLRKTHDLLADLFVPRAAIFWCDLALTTAVSYVSALAYLRAPVWSARQAIAFLIAGFAFFRLGTFIHEIAHLRKGALKGFRTAWNVVCGVPFLMPHFLYSNHIDHHQWRHYGTPQDGEYLPLAIGPARQLFYYALEILLLPMFAVLRFLVLTPLSLAFPSSREWVLSRFSSYVSNFGYRRRLRAADPARTWLAWELACFFNLAIAATLLLSGVIPWEQAAKAYALAVFTVGLNWLRNLAGHRFLNDGRELDYFGQLNDSITVIGNPLWTELLFPLGLRYHALHHLFPAIPYHNLGKAHCRLMELLPADSPYHKTIYSGLWPVLVDLWRNARAHGSAEAGVMAWPDGMRRSQRAQRGAYVSGFWRRQRA